jgi:hypothetical protein
LLAEPVLPLLRARGGVLEAHLGDGHLGHVDQGVHPDVPGDRRHEHGRLQVPGGHGQAEVDPPTAADDPQDVGRFQEVADHHLGASSPQGRRPVVVAADHGAHRQPALEEQAGHGAPDRPELPGGPSDEDGSVLGHVTFFPYTASVMIRDVCPAKNLWAAFVGRFAFSTHSKTFALLACYGRGGQAVGARAAIQSRTVLHPGLS